MCVCECCECCECGPTSSPLTLTCVWLQVAGAWVIERGYSGSQVIRGVYPAQNHSTKAPWPPTTAELAAATVDVGSTSGCPQLFKRT